MLMQVVAAGIRTLKTRQLTLFVWRQKQPHVTLPTNGSICRSVVSAQTVDEVNILQAALAAMSEAVAALDSGSDYVIVDGNRLPPVRVAPRVRQNVPAKAVERSVAGGTSAPLRLEWEKQCSIVTGRKPNMWVRRGEHDVDQSCKASCQCTRHGRSLVMQGGSIETDQSAAQLCRRPGMQEVVGSSACGTAPTMTTTRA
jgi:hypothetical protein